MSFEAQAGPAQGIAQVVGIVDDDGQRLAADEAVEKDLGRAHVAGLRLSDERGDDLPQRTLKAQALGGCLVAGDGAKVEGARTLGPARARLATWGEASGVVAVGLVGGVVWGGHCGFLRLGKR